MIEKIEKCWCCGNWFDVKVLQAVFVSSQGGDIKKPICEGCIEAIEKRSRKQQNNHRRSNRILSCRGQSLTVVLASTVVVIGKEHTQPQPQESADSGDPGPSGDPWEP